MLNWLPFARSKDNLKAAWGGRGFQSIVVRSNVVAVVWCYCERLVQACRFSRVNDEA